MPHTDSIAPTKSHTERSFSSSHPDRCLYAMLAFTEGYALSRMLCTTAVRLRTVVSVSVFRFFVRTWSCLLLIVGHHCCTRTPSTKSKHNFLSAERGFSQVTGMDPSPPSASDTYLSVIYFFNRILFCYVFM